ncbi:MAG: acetylglutamate kinase [Candidatus Latescibacterota bacterium]
MTQLQEYIDKASVLVEALPYIQAFRDKVVVLKHGGSTMTQEGSVDTVLKDVVFMESVGIKPVIVHGGGPAISRRLEELGVPTRKVNGLRVTDEPTMRVVEEVLCGQINAEIVSTIRQLGGRAVGISGRDGVLHVRRHVARTPEGPVDLGFVGDVERVDPEPLLAALRQGLIAVLAPIGLGPCGHSYNVNADTAAGRVAAALDAEKLVFLTDVKGIMGDPADEDSLLSTVRVAQVPELIAGGIVSGGMIPKVEACVASVEAGVRKTHVIDGRIPHSMLLEFFTREGIGTQIVQ